MFRLPDLRPEFFDSKKYPLPAIIFFFQKEHSNLRHEKLNGMQMRRVLAGELIVVHVKNKFALWERKRIENGELDALNSKIKEKNRETRIQQAREREQFFRQNPELEKAMNRLKEIEDMFKFFLK